MKHRVLEHKLSSGAAGLVVDVPGSEVVNFQVRFNSGFQFADRRRYEVPHVMEHVLATVTKRHPGANEFIVEAQKNGAYVNAMTSADVNGYLYECADFELERMLNLLEEQLTEPFFAEEAFAAEVGNVREELSRNTTQHGSVCAVALAAAAFPRLWLDYDERIGQLEGIGLEDVAAHYRRTHTAANARFYVAGHFPDGGERLVGRLERMFGRLEGGSRLERDQSVGRGLAAALAAKRDIAQLYYRTAMYFGELAPAERRALTLLRMVLVGGMGARILGEARRRGLAYSVGGTGHAELGNSSFGFAGYVTPANAEALFGLIGREFRAVRDGGLRESELEAARKLMVGSVKRSTQTVGDILGWYVDDYDEMGQIRLFEDELELVGKVTVEEVTAIAAKASQSGRSGVSFVGPVDEVKAEDYRGLLGF